MFKALKEKLGISNKDLNKLKQKEGASNENGGTRLIIENSAVFNDENSTTDSTSDPKQEDSKRESTSESQISNPKKIKSILDHLENQGACTDLYDPIFLRLAAEINSQNTELWAGDEKMPADNAFHRVAKLPGVTKLIKLLLQSGVAEGKTPVSFLSKTNKAGKTPIEIAIENGQYENFEIFLKAQMLVENFKETREEFLKLLLQAMLRISPTIWSQNQTDCMKIYNLFCETFPERNVNLFFVKNRGGIDWHNDSPLVRHLLNKAYMENVLTLRAFKANAEFIKHDLNQAAGYFDNLKLLLEIYAQNKIDFRVSPENCADFMGKVLFHHYQNDVTRTKCEDILRLFLLKLKTGKLTPLNHFIANPSGQNVLKDMDSFAALYAGDDNFQKYLKAFFAANYSNIHQQRGMNVKTKPAPIVDVQGCAANSTYVQVRSPIHVSDRDVRQRAVSDAPPPPPRFSNSSVSFLRTESVAASTIIDIRSSVSASPSDTRPSFSTSANSKVTPDEMRISFSISSGDAVSSPTQRATRLSKS